MLLQNEKEEGESKLLTFVPHPVVSSRAVSSSQSKAWGLKPTTKTKQIKRVEGDLEILKSEKSS